MKNGDPVAVLPLQHGFDDEFCRLEATFRFVSRIPSAAKREFILSRLAAGHDLTKSEAKRLFRMWLVEAGSQEDEE